MTVRFWRLFETFKSPKNHEYLQHIFCTMSSSQNMSSRNQRSTTKEVIIISQSDLEWKLVWIRIFSTDDFNWKKIRFRFLIPKMVSYRSTLAIRFIRIRTSTGFMCCCCSRCIRLSVVSDSFLSCAKIRQVNPVAVFRRFDTNPAMTLCSSLLSKWIGIVVFNGIQSDKSPHNLSGSSKSDECRIVKKSPFSQSWK